VDFAQNDFLQEPSFLAFRRGRMMAGIGPASKTAARTKSEQAALSSKTALIGRGGPVSRKSSPAPAAQAVGDGQK
jgi:hypothetical protein